MTDDFRIITVEAMAGPVNLELDPVFLKGLSYLHSKSKDSAEKLKALLDESLSRGSDTSYRLLQKVRILFRLHHSFVRFLRSLQSVVNNYVRTVFVACVSSGYRCQRISFKTELE